MANWISSTIRVMGSAERVQQIKNLLDQHTSEQHGERVTQFSDIVGDENTDVMWGIRSHPDDEEDLSIVWMGDSKWEPPGNFVNELSRRYPDCEFRLAFSQEAPGYVEKYVFQDGDSRLTYEQAGCFEFRGHDTSPVHHWRVGLSIEEDEDVREAVLTALIEHGLLVDVWHRMRFRRSGEDILEWVRERFPEAEVEVRYSTPYTLIEDYYLEEVYDELTDCGGELSKPYPLQIAGDYQELLSVVERDIELTNDELHEITKDLTRQMTVGVLLNRRVYLRVERLRNHLGREQFDERYLPLLSASALRGDQEFIQQWFVTPSAVESAELGYRPPYRPTAAELRMLLEHYDRHPDLPVSKERVAVITGAIQSPRWTREWPRWEQEQRAREAAAQAAVDTNEVPFLDEDFLRELDEMSDRKHDPQPELDWREAGF